MKTIELESSLPASMSPYAVAAALREGADPNGPDPLWMRAARGGATGLRILARAKCRFEPAPLAFASQAPLDSACWLWEATLCGAIALHETPEQAWTLFRAHAMRLFEARLIDHAHRQGIDLNDSQRGRRFDLGLAQKPGPEEPFETWAAKLWLDRQRLQSLAGSPPPKTRARADNQPHWLDAPLRLGSLFIGDDPWIWARGLAQLFAPSLGPESVHHLVAPDQQALASWAGACAVEFCSAPIPLTLAQAAQSGSPQAIACALAAGALPGPAPVATLLRSLARQWSVDLDKESEDEKIGHLALLVQRAMQVLETNASVPEPLAAKLLLSCPQLPPEPQVLELARTCLRAVEKRADFAPQLPALFPGGPTVSEFARSHPLRGAAAAIERWAEAQELAQCAGAAPSKPLRPL